MPQYPRNVRVGHFGVVEGPEPDFVEIKSHIILCVLLKKKDCKIIIIHFLGEINIYLK